MEADGLGGILLDERGLSERASFDIASRCSFDLSGKIRVAWFSSSSDSDATARASVQVESGEMDTLAVGACFRTSVAICLRRCAVDISNL
jgi:hypothetical protein